MLARIRVTQHALERYRIHHPEAESRDVVSAIRAGEEVTGDLVRSLTSRRAPPKSAQTDRYYVSPDTQGIFVVAQDGSAVTYLRLQPSQQAILTRSNTTDETQSRHYPAEILTEGPEAVGAGTDVLREVGARGIEELYQLLSLAQLQKRVANSVHFELMGCPLIAVRHRGKWTISIRRALEN